MFMHPGANPRLPEHKSADFVLEKPENEGFLCSKSPKMGVPKPQKAQKTRFCALEEGRAA